jgi:hypothetical protein
MCLAMSPSAQAPSRTTAIVTCWTWIGKLEVDDESDDKAQDDSHGNI